MNVIRLRVTHGNHEAIVDVLNERNVDFLTIPTDGDTTVVEFPIPTDALGDVLGSIRETGLDDEYIVVLNAINASTPHTEELQNRYANDYDPLRLPELRSKARDFSSDPRSFGVMVFLSAAIAAIGLLVDSPAVMIGSMVIAPLIGPVLTATVGAITGDRTMVVHSLRMQALGLSAAIVGAFVMAFLIQVVGLVPPPLELSSVELIGLRMAPTPLSILVGFIAGIAATFGLTTKGTKSLVGVLIAAALVPAAAASGIGVAYGEPRIAVGSAALLVGTIAAVNLGMYATLRVLYRSQKLDSALLTDRTLSRAAVITVALVVIGAAVAGYAAVEQTSFQRTVGEETGAILEEPAYTDLGLVSTRYQYGGPLWLAGSPNVTVAVTRPANTSYPALPDRLTERIADATGRNVTVNVRFQSVGRPTRNVSSQ
jgi:uncharacterized hydrophobic protein (TIGR00271 family)